MTAGSNFDAFLESALDTGGAARDHKDRPMLIPRGETERVPYERASGFADLVQNKGGLDIWERRYLAIGLSDPNNADIRNMLAGETYQTFYPMDDKEKRASGKRVDDLIRRVLDRQGIHRAADHGTAVHSYTDPFNLGPVPPEVRRAVAGFWKALDEHDLEVLECEFFLANDTCRGAGTADHLILNRKTGRTHIGDAKGLPLDTPLPTPSGWTTIGEVSVGDEVFGSDGRVARVVEKSKVHHRPCYRVTFDDGRSQVCDDEHLWPVWRITRQAGRPNKRIESVVSTVELKALLDGRRGQRDLCVDVPMPLDLPQSFLPIDPYVLGLWLGDGKHSDGSLCSNDPWIFEHVELLGYPVGPNHAGRNRTPQRTIYGLMQPLKSLGILRNKHIPLRYLRASRLDREALLQGLLDSDGCWNTARNSVSITQTRRDLAEDIEELLLSLGQRVHFAKIKTRGFGKEGEAFKLTFTPTRGLSPFRLPRKREQVAAPSDARSTRRLIVSVEEVESVPTQCIAVDSPDRTYLCGRSMLVTHNTGKKQASHGVQLGIYAHAERYDTDTDERAEIHPDLDPTIGYVFDIKPEGTQVIEVKTDVGFRIACAIDMVRRDLNIGSLMKNLGKRIGVPEEQGEEFDAITAAVARCRSREELDDLWTKAQGFWQDHHTEAARARVAELEGE